MYVCYLDESGGYEAPDSNRSATPVMVILGLIVDAASIPALTRDFLALKRRHFPGRYAAGHALDHILTEVKGSDILHMTRSSGRNSRRQAQRLRQELVDLAERYDCRIVGRVWVKEPGKGLAPDSSYCYAVQDIAKHFAQYLEAQDKVGVMIADSRRHHTNMKVAHSIFTQKWRTGGDPYPPLQEVPLFAASDNHAGLQIADLIASTLIFPMAASAYCPRQPGPHYSPKYAEVRAMFGLRVRSRQYRYRDEAGRWRGGLVVSDRIGKQPGARLFA
ncbi:DUF3800 domain-containing protein [Actinomadura craniellae]|uniref:DUF3800 domain-containing protein n=1 Tax=Actinomadura craniellae TaxID=2231787 RepID=A0A365H1B6_9ACTN|nr:DUF3800 domain-containing protein [Actinomadura craniellae]RAY12882.1 DUF3800 domain-containing protein [Actinomadura craniellae]